MSQSCDEYQRDVKTIWTLSVIINAVKMVHGFVITLPGQTRPWEEDLKETYEVVDAIKTVQRSITTLSKSVKMMPIEFL